MTNREWLESLSDEELGYWLCDQRTDCKNGDSTCPAYDMCNDFGLEGFIPWLRENHHAGVQSGDIGGAR